MHRNSQENQLMKRQKISKSHPTLLTPHLQLQTSQDFVSTRSKSQNFVLASIQGFLLLRTEGQQGCQSSHALLFALPVLHSLLLMATVPVHWAALPLKSFCFCHREPCICHCSSQKALSSSTESRYLGLGAPGNLILVDTHSKVAGSPQPGCPECFHWERLKHLNRS